MNNSTIIEIQNMENLDNSQWRSADSMSDNLDESVTETVNSSFHSYSTQKDSDDCNYCENGLLNAMTNLKIVSAKNSEQFHLSDIAKAICIDSICDDNNIPVENSKIIQVQEPEKSVCTSPKKSIKSPSLLPKLKPQFLCTSSKSMLLNNTITSKNTKKINKTLVKTVTKTADGIQLKEEKINHFAIPIVSRKKNTTTIPFSFLNRNNNKLTPKNKQSFETTNKDVIVDNRKSSISFKKNTTQNDRKSVTLNNNKSSITNSKVTPTIAKKSISITTSLSSTRTKSDLTNIQKLDNKKISQENKKISNITGNTNKSTLIRMNPSISKNRNSVTNIDKLNNGNINNENKIPNNIINNTKPNGQLVKVRNTKLHTDVRAKERNEFDVMLREKNIEIEKMRKELEKKQREKEKLEELALRKTMEHKANPMPEFKRPAPIRSHQILTMPRSPAWAFKHNNAL